MRAFTLLECSLVFGIFSVLAVIMLTGSTHTLMNAYLRDSQHAVAHLLGKERERSMHGMQNPADSPFHELSGSLSSEGTFASTSVLVNQEGAISER
jgi:hypothetical protein